MPHYAIYGTSSHTNTYVIIKLLILAGSCFLPVFINDINEIEGHCSPALHLEIYFNEDVMKQNVFWMEDNDSK